MIYRITYNGDKLTSKDGYHWKAVDSAAAMSAVIVNRHIEEANHHDPVQVIFERMGDRVKVESLPNDSSDDT